MNSPMPSVEVIVVLWNHRPFVEALMQGLRVSDYPHEALTVHIVDNASSDSSLDAVRAFMAAHADLPKIVLHEPGKNLGFAGGNNLILKTSQADYAFLLNPDAALNQTTLREAVAVAVATPNAGSVQPVIVLANRPDKLNSLGNDIHFAAFGYCRGYQRPIADAPQVVTPIAYASGAGVLYRMSALRCVGLFDETLFAYHEDLDLGWRLLLAGYDNVLAPKSVLRHHYEFSRSIKKWFWMERNRWIVYFKNYRLPTILLTLPAMIVIEFATWLFALKGGWVKEKARAMGWFFKPSSWGYLIRARRSVQATRKQSDRSILKRFVYGIEYQEVSNGFIQRIANPLMHLYFVVLKAVTLW